MESDTTQLPYCCQFCGSTSSGGRIDYLLEESDPVYRVVCCNRGCQGSPGKTRKEAIALWNTPIKPNSTRIPLLTLKNSIADTPENRQRILSQTVLGLEPPYTGRNQLPLWFQKTVHLHKRVENFKTPHWLYEISFRHSAFNCFREWKKHSDGAELLAFDIMDALLRNPIFSASDFGKNIPFYMWVGTNGLLEQYDITPFFYISMPDDSFAVKLAKNRHIEIMNEKIYRESLRIPPVKRKNFMSQLAEIDGKNLVIVDPTIPTDLLVMAFEKAINKSRQSIKNVTTHPSYRSSYPNWYKRAVLAYMDKKLWEEVTGRFFYDAHFYEKYVEELSVPISNTELRRNGLTKTKEYYRLLTNPQILKNLYVQTVLEQQDVIEPSNSLYLPGKKRNKRP